jgi:hypothetical protein
MESFDFKEIQPKLDQSFEVISPRYFGDSEIINIAMSLSAVEITFQNNGADYDRDGKTWNASLIKLVVSGTEFMTFESNHLQNVVASVNVYDRETVKSVRDEPHYPFKHIPSTHRPFAAEIYVVVKATTGGDFFLVGTSIRLFEKRTSPWKSD